MPQPNKEELYFIIEEYMKSRTPKWGLDPEKPVDCPIGITFNILNKRRAKEKRETILDVVSHIYKANSTESWINTLYQIEGHIAKQTSKYENGYSNYMNSKQQLTRCLADIKNVILLYLSSKNSIESILLDTARKEKARQLLNKQKKLDSSNASLYFFSSTKDQSNAKSLVNQATIHVNALTCDESNNVVIPSFLVDDMEIYVNCPDYSLDEKCPITAKFIDHISTQQEQHPQGKFLNR